MEIDRRALKRQARERMALTDPKFWVVALAYIAMTTGVAWLFSLVPTPGTGSSPVPFIDTVQIFLQLLLILYQTVVQFGLCLWALWTWRQLDPGVSSLMQGFSVAGRVLLMELSILFRTLGWYFPVALALSVPFTMVLVGVGDYGTRWIFVLLFVICLFIALYAISLRYALAPYLLADRPDDGFSIPILRSVELMRGWKMELFKLELSFIGWELINLALSFSVLLLRAPPLPLPRRTADARGNPDGDLVGPADGRHLFHADGHPAHPGHRPGIPMADPLPVGVGGRVL